MNRITLKKEDITISVQVVKITEAKSVLYVSKQKGNGLSNVEPKLFKLGATSTVKPYDLAVIEAEKEISKKEKLGFIKI